MPRKRYTQPEVTLPTSLHQEARLLKKFVDVAEVKEEMGALLAKAIATLDWLLEHGTPGTKLGAAQTVLQPFVPRAPQVVEQLNYDVADLDPEQQKAVLRLAKEYRSVVGTAGERRGLTPPSEASRTEAQSLLLDAPDPDDDSIDFGPGWEDASPSSPEPGEGPDPDRGEQVREIDLGLDRSDPLEPGSPPVQEDATASDVHPDSDPGPAVPKTSPSDSGHVEELDASYVAPGPELDDSVGG